MKIRIKVNQSVDRSPCAHQNLTLAGRSLRLQGLHLKRSTERYTCNACGTPLVRTLKMPTCPNLPAPHHQATETSPSDTGNWSPANRLLTSALSAKRVTTAPPPIHQARLVAWLSPQSKNRRFSPAAPLFGCIWCGLCCLCCCSLFPYRQKISASWLRTRFTLLRHPISSGLGIPSLQTVEGESGSG